MSPDERSIALHAEVAARLLADPTLIDAARERVRGWLASGRGAHPNYARRWLEILEQPAVEIAALLASHDDEAATLRSVSPFAGVLAPRERWAILRELRP